MSKILTFLRLCKVLPEVDEKQQSTINGGKVFVNERLWGRDLNDIHVILPVCFIQHGGGPVHSGLVPKCRFTIHERQCLSVFSTPIAVEHGLTVYALLRMSVATSAPRFGFLFWLHKYGRTGSDDLWKV